MREGIVQKKLELQGKRLYAIDLIEKAPAVFAELTYLAPSPKGKLLGKLKVMMYSNDSAPVACLHDELGYLLAFRRAAGALASAVAKARADASSAFTYRTVHVMTIKGAPVGFERSRYLKAKDGSRAGVTVSALFLSRSQTEWIAQDSIVRFSTDKDGYYDEKRFVGVANGEVGHDITLKRGKKNAYSYSGTLSGKELSGQFKTQNARGLVSDLLVAQGVKKEMLTGKKSELTFEQYSPEADPTGPQVMTVRKEPQGPLAVSVELAKMKMMATVDASGDTEMVELQMGPMTLLQERKLVEGTLE